MKTETEPTNAQRADRGRKTLEFYASLLNDGTVQDVANGSYHTALQDLISDVLHADNVISTEDDPPFNDETFIEGCNAALLNFERERDEVVKEVLS